jgi:peptidoglycan/xylan/chitin deacetylase (PgdA/CDA1 family)
MHRLAAILFAAATIAGGFCAAVLGAAPARAEDCPGHPDALGTSRVLVVSPQDYDRLGSMQYKQTLPLADHEVVITFDDGPLPPWSDKTLDILTSQCVKATYFIVGEMARAFPQVVRREYEAGYTIGTHSQDHPVGFERLSGDRLSYEIDAGIASVSAALGDRDELAPFFRIPGLGRSKAVEDALAQRSLVVFSADVVADDWFHHIKPEQIVQRAMSRLEKRGSGILLLHDIHPWTIAALPVLLKELKDHGFHVVQLVPPAPTSPEIAGGPKAWALAAAVPQPNLVDKDAVSPEWPQPNAGPAADSVALPAPDAAAFNIDESLQNDFTLVEEDTGTAQWPKLTDLAPSSSATDFPVPGLREIGVSLRDGRLVGADLGLRRNLDVPISITHSRSNERVHATAHGRSIARSRSTEHEQVHHARLHGHHPVARGKFDHHRADLLPEVPKLTALLMSWQAL